MQRQSPTSNYRRNYVPGGTYFFTVVTHQRRQFFTTEIGRACLRQAINEEREKRPFTQLAIVLLPEHLHAIWTLPPQDADYSLRWKQIKQTFTRLYLESGGEEGTVSLSRLRRRERAVLQRRFWEHTCEDEDDLKRFLDYLHWNPVKNGLAKLPREYSWSSFHRFVEMGEYPINWGGVDPCPGYDDPEWQSVATRFRLIAFRWASKTQPTLRTHHAERDEYHDSRPTLGFSLEFP